MPSRSIPVPVRLKSFACIQLGRQEERDMRRDVVIVAGTAVCANQKGVVFWKALTAMRRNAQAIE